MKLQLATHGSLASTPGKPDAATHVLMYWPPSAGSLLGLLRKKVTRSGEWTIFTLLEYLTGDYCQGDRWTLEAPRRKPVADLGFWVRGELGRSVALQYAGETEYGPVYWVTTS
jgi:hypothetical protein